VSRLAVLLLLAAVVALATWAWRRRDRALQRHDQERLVPAELLGPGDRTWVLFRTPFCATCGPAAERLRADDPGAALVEIDATQRPDLADALGIAAAPTVLLAGPDGRVQVRLSVPRAVHRHLDGLLLRS
jgi:hypothetical protein